MIEPGKKLLDVAIHVRDDIAEFLGGDDDPLAVPKRLERHGARFAREAHGEVAPDGDRLTIRRLAHRVG